MIRALWAYLNTGAATLVFGLVAIFASLLRVRGGIYSWATRQWARAILWASGVSVVVHGAEQIRSDAPQIVVSNHVSGYDVFALASALEVPFYFVAKKELERIPFFGIAWKAAGHISIDRSNRQSALESLRRGGRRVREENGAVIIFPEGTRSRTGELQPFKKGAFMLAIEAQVPVVPTIVAGSRGIVGRWGAVRPRPVHVHFGEPIPTAGMEPGASDPLLDVTRARMQALSEAAKIASAPGAT